MSESKEKISVQLNARDSAALLVALRRSASKQGQDVQLRIGQYSPEVIRVPINDQTRPDARTLVLNANGSWFVETTVEID